MERFAHMRVDPETDTAWLAAKYQYLRSKAPMRELHWMHIENVLYYGEGRGHPSCDYDWVPYYVREPGRLLNERMVAPMHLGPWHFNLMQWEWGWLKTQMWLWSPRCDFNWYRVKDKYGEWPMSLDPENIDPKTGKTTKPVDYPPYKPSWDHTVKLRDYINKRTAEMKNMA